MRKRRILLICFILHLSFILSAESPSRMIIDSGHNDSIESMAYHSKSGYLLTADTNGLVKVWDLASDKLVYQINTGFRGTIILKVHPERNQFAIQASRPGNTQIAVWDWEENKELFHKELQDKPIQFEYSGQGRYLFFTKISTPSIVMMDSQSGREYSYLKRINDFISFGYIGSSETRIMTYSNSGFIKYWDIRTSALQNETSTLTDLSDITVLQTEGKRYFVSRKGNTFYLIDRLSGSVRDSITIEDMFNFSVDSENGVITAALQSRTGRFKVTAFTTEGAHFAPLDLNQLLSKQSLSAADGRQDSTDSFTISSNLTGSFVTGNRIFLSGGNGVIWELNSETLKPSIFKKNNLSDIKDLNFMEDSLYILSSRELLQLESSGFTKKRNAALSSFSDIAISQTDSPLPGESEIESVDSDKMIIWTKDSVRKGYVLFDAKNKTVLNSNYNFNSIINQLHVRGDQVLVLENSGEASLNNLHTGFRDFQFSSLGMVSLNFLDDNTLLGGKSLMKTGRNSMFTVQTDTGEIIPLQDSRFLVYGILTPDDSNKIFTIGLSQRDSSTVETSIMSHSTSSPFSGIKIYTQQGEWINAIFTADATTYTPTLYGTISGREIVRISGTRKRTWDYDKNIEKLFFHNGLIYILNTDGSLSLFSPQTGNKLLDFYLMEDQTWIVLPGQDASKPYLSTSEAAEYLNTFNEITGREMRDSYYVIKQNDNLNQ